MITVEEARRHYEGAESAHDFEHVLRVLHLVERIGAAEGADLEILRTAALLHDVARSLEHDGGPDHAQAGAAQAREILRGHDAARVEAVAAAIASHRFRAGPPPATLEARILFDADKLDAIGAIGIARAYAIAGVQGQRLWADVPPGYGDRPPQAGITDLEDGEHTPVHEYVFKLARLKDRLFTQAARAIAAERHEYMVGYFERLAREVAGAL